MSSSPNLLKLMFYKYLKIFLIYRQNAGKQGPLNQYSIPKTLLNLNQVMVYNWCDESQHFALWMKSSLCFLFLIVTNEVATNK